MSSEFSMSTIKSESKGEFHCFKFNSCTILFLVGNYTGHTHSIYLLTKCFSDLTLFSNCWSPTGDNTDFSPHLWA